MLLTICTASLWKGIAIGAAAVITLGGYLVKHFTKGDTECMHDS